MFGWYSVKIRVIFGVRFERRKVDKKSKPTGKLKHANSILETFEYFCQISSKSIHIISSYTVLKLGPFFETQCSLRRRTHQFRLPDHRGRLMDCNFLIRSLFKECLLISSNTFIQLTHHYILYRESALCQFFIKLVLHCRPYCVALRWYWYWCVFVLYCMIISFPCDSIQKRAICCRKVSVHPSVRLSITIRYCTVSKRLNWSSTFCNRPIAQHPSFPRQISVTTRALL